MQGKERIAHSRHHARIRKTCFSQIFPSTRAEHDFSKAPWQLGWLLRLVDPACSIPEQILQLRVREGHTFSLRGLIHDLTVWGPGRNYCACQITTVYRPRLTMSNKYILLSTLPHAYISQRPALMARIHVQGALSTLVGLEPLEERPRCRKLSAMGLPSTAIADIAR